MIALTENKVDNFVEKLQRKGIDVRWDGWKMVFHKPHPAALRSKDGRISRKTLEYGFETVVSPNEQGKWLVDYRLTKG